jgi:hypothetical protein
MARNPQALHIVRTETRQDRAPVTGVPPAGILQS